MNQIMNPYIRYPEKELAYVNCAFCGQNVTVWYAAHGVHSCMEPDCLQKIEELHTYYRFHDVKPPTPCLHPHKKSNMQLALLLKPYKHD